MFSYSNGVMLISTNRKQVLSRRLTLINSDQSLFLSVKNEENNGVLAGVPLLSPSRAQIPSSPSPFNACHVACYSSGLSENNFL